jgi:hypothetical protein
LSVVAERTIENLLNCRNLHEQVLAQGFYAQAK